jgi:hypothetical protein
VQLLTSHCPAALFALACLIGCGHADDPAADDSVPVVVPPGNRGVAPIEVDGVWVFFMSGAWGEQALLGGEARIEDGCLLVGERLVLWSAGQASLAEGLVVDVRSGAAPVVRLAGGESNDVPAAVSDRCAVDVVWRANSYEMAR